MKTDNLFIIAVFSLLLFVNGGLIVLTIAENQLVVEGECP